MLELVATTTGVRDLLHAALQLLKGRLDCGAVGARLAHGDDYPYFEAEGFSQRFLELEDRLAHEDASGEPVYDASGAAALDCMCGVVLRGRTDPTQPFFTPFGSFWTASTSELLATTTAEDRGTVTRNLCNTLEGFESMTLIPLRGDRGQVHGLLHLADRRAGRLDLPLIRDLELAATHLGLALSGRLARATCDRARDTLAIVADFSADWEYWLDADGGLAYVSPRAVAVTGYSRDELRARPALLEELVHPDDRARFADHPHAGREIEFRIVDRQGDERWIGHTCQRVTGQDGRPRGLRVSNREVTDRKRAEQRLAAERDRLELVTSGIGVGLTIITRDFHIEWQNGVMHALYGDPAGRCCHEHYNGRPAVCPDCGVRQVFAGAERVEHEQLGHDRDGRPIWAQMIVTPIRDASGQVTTALEVVLPITERKCMEAELVQSRESLRRLSQRLQVAAEEERTRIAREIHDLMAQKLTALTIDLHWLTTRTSDAEAAVAERLQEMKANLTAVAAATRDLITEIRPGVLDHLGLVAAVEWQTRQFARRAGIGCDVSSTVPSVALDGERTTAVFRAFQETLTNVARHARASRVEVGIRAEDDSTVCLQVIDDGIGIDARAAAAPDSLGLLGMRERLKHVGGRVEVEGRPGRGTTVRIIAPTTPRDDRGSRTYGPTDLRTYGTTDISDITDIADMKNEDIGG